MIKHTEVAMTTPWMYVCLNTRCGATGVTTRTPDFTRDFIGFLCDACRPALYHAGTGLQFCLACHRVVRLIQRDDPRFSSATPDDRIEYIERCEECSGREFLRGLRPMPPAPSAAPRRPPGGAAD